MTDSINVIPPTPEVIVVTPPTTPVVPINVGVSEGQVVVVNPLSTPVSQVTVGVGQGGATGPAGPPGAQGPQGPAGADGAAGTNGTNGTNGTSGVIDVTSPITNSGSSTAAQLGLDQTALSIAPSQVTGTAVITNDSRLSDQRTPLDNSVTSAKIVNGTIVDEDINAAAAIATSKVNGLDTALSQLTKLIPAAPTAFPGGTALIINSTTPLKMAFQTTNQGGTVIPKDTQVNVRTASSYSTNTIGPYGPGTSGTISLVKNGTSVVSKTLTTGNDNGSTVVGNDTLTISGSANYPSDVQDFWQVVSASATGAVGSATAGWNRLQLNHSGASNTAPVDWYYDNSAISAPTFASNSFTVASSSTVNSSGIPHYSAAIFNLNTTVSNLMGNTYPTTNFANVTAVSPFASATKTYTDLGITTGQSLAAQAISVPVSLSVTGFGSTTTKPTLRILNVTAESSQNFTTVDTRTILYKTNTALDETAISSTLGSTNNKRIILATNTGDTPSNTGVQTVYTPSTSLLSNPAEAKVVAGALKWDATNYSTDFLPVGPNYSTHTGTQYFTFKFQKASLSKFDISLTSSTGITGCWVMVPTSDMMTSCDSTSGWMAMTKAVNGLGIIGPAAPGVTGTNGCAVSSSVIPVNSALSGSYTCTFNTYSTSSSTQSNEVYVRIALVSGQSVSALSIGTATR